MRSRAHFTLLAALWILPWGTPVEATQQQRVVICSDDFAAVEAATQARPGFSDFEALYNNKFKFETPVAQDSGVRGAIRNGHLTATDAADLDSRLSTARYRKSVAERDGDPDADPRSYSAVEFWALKAQNDHYLVDKMDVTSKLTADAYREAYREAFREALLSMDGDDFRYRDLWPLIDGVDTTHFKSPLLIAHTRKLKPEELARFDELLRDTGKRFEAKVNPLINSYGPLATRYAAGGKAMEHPSRWFSMGHGDNPRLAEVDSRLGKQDLGDDAAPRLKDRAVARQKTIQTLYSLWSSFKKRFGGSDLFRDGRLHGEVVAWFRKPPKPDAEHFTDTFERALQDKAGGHVSLSPTVRSALADWFDFKSRRTDRGADPDGKTDATARFEVEEALRTLPAGARDHALALLDSVPHTPKELLVADFKAMLKSEGLLDEVEKHGPVEKFFDDSRKYYELVDLFLPSPPPGRDRPIDYRQPGARQTTADIREVGKNNFLSAQGELANLFGRAERAGDPPTAHQVVAAAQHGFNTFTEKMDAYKILYENIVTSANKKTPGPDEPDAKYFQATADDMVGFLKDGRPDAGPELVERMVRLMDDPPAEVRGKLRREWLPRTGLRLASVVTTQKDLAEALAHCDAATAKRLLGLVPEGQHPAILAEAERYRSGAKAPTTEGTRIDAGPALSTQLEGIAKDLEKKYRFKDAAILPELIPFTPEAGRQIGGDKFTYKGLVNLHIAGEIPDRAQLGRIEAHLRSKLAGLGYVFGQVTYKHIPPAVRGR